MLAKRLANGSYVQLVGPGQSVSLAWLKLAALLQQGPSSVPWQKPTVATTIMFVILAVMCAVLCIIHVRHGVRAQWLPKLHGSWRSRLPTTSFVVALSFEHMAFHVFVQAGYSDPHLFCPRTYRINYTAT